MRMQLLAKLSKCPAIKQYQCKLTSMQSVRKVKAKPESKPFDLAA